MQLLQRLHQAEMLLDLQCSQIKGNHPTCVLGEPDLRYVHAYAPESLQLRMHIGWLQSYAHCASHGCVYSAMPRSAAPT